MNVALKSKKGSDSIVSPDQYAILSKPLSTDHVTPPTSANLYVFPRKPDMSRLVPWASKHARTHWSFCKRNNVIGTMKETCSMKKSMRIRPKDRKNRQKKEFHLDP